MKYRRAQHGPYENVHKNVYASTQESNLYLIAGWLLHKRGVIIVKQNDA